MPTWLIVLLSALGVLYFGFNGWYTWQWRVSDPAMRHRQSTFYTLLLFFFALPAITALIAFSFVLPKIRWARQPFQRSHRRPQAKP